MSETLEVGRVIHKIPIGQIDISGFNCRGEFKMHECVDLAKEIKELGLLNPVLVRPNLPGATLPYRLVAGFRRVAAHRLNNATTIDAEIRELTDRDAAIINLTENLNRIDLNIMQEAEAVIRFKTHMGMTYREIGERVGRSQKWVQIRVWATEMEPEIQDDLRKGTLKQQDLEKLHSIEPGEARYEAAKKLKEAKAKGEKIKLVQPKSVNPYIKKLRSKEDIETLQDHILAEFGGGTYGNLPVQCQDFLRFLGWVAGAASDMEIYSTLQRIATETGYEYAPPVEAMSYV